MSTLVQDVRYALRALRRSPAFAAVAVFSLAAGIGGNAAIFAVFDAALLRPLAVEEPERLVRVTTDRGNGRVNYNLSQPLYESYATADAFAGVVAHTTLPLTYEGSGGARSLDGAAVSSEFFRVLGTGASRGRLFTAEESRAGLPVVVLGHAFWRTVLGGDADVIGGTIRLGGQPVQVVGVAERAFGGLVRGGPAAFYVPLASYPRFTGRDWTAEPAVSWLDVFARLRPGLSRDAAAAAMSGLDAGLVERGLIGEGQATLLHDGSRGIESRLVDYGTPLTILMAAVGLVLLIACANVANLLLARSAARSRELAIRRSVGAGGMRLLRQLLTESVVLALAGGTLGLGLAVWGADLLASFRPSTGEALALDTSLDARVLGFTFALSLATGVLFGLVPALRGARTAPALALKEHANTTTGRLGLRGGLVAGQVAVSLALLVGAGLLLRSMQRLAQVDPGYDARGVLLARIDLDPQAYPGPRRLEFWRTLVERAGALPGVRGATLARTVTPHPWGGAWDGVQLEGYQSAPDETIGFEQNTVGPDYFATLRTAILRGRAFDARDRAGAPRVAIINEAMARRYWPDGDAVGRRILTGNPEEEDLLIVGVAASGKYRSLRESEAYMVWLPLEQDPRASLTLMVRNDGDPDALVAPVRALVGELDAAVPVQDVRSLERHVALAFAGERMAASLGTALAVFSLLLAIVGLYGVLAILVAQRRREIGVRMALGARPGDLVRMVVGRAMTMVAAGVAAGAVLGTLLSRGLVDLLYGLSPGDPLTVAGAAVVLVGAALVAAWLPARRAARTDPVRALAGE